MLSVTLLGVAPVEAVSGAHAALPACLRFHDGPAPDAAQMHSAISPAFDLVCHYLPSRRLIYIADCRASAIYIEGLTIADFDVVAARCYATGDETRHALMPLPQLLNAYESRRIEQTIFAVEHEPRRLLFPRTSAPGAAAPAIL